MDRRWDQQRGLKLEMSGEQTTSMAETPARGSGFPILPSKLEGFHRVHQVVMPVLAVETPDHDECGPSIV